MKLKSLVLASTILSITPAINADFKDDLKNRFIHAQAYVQANPTQVAKVGIAAIATIGGAGFTTAIAWEYWTKPQNFDFIMYSAVATVVTGTVSGYLVLNHELKNRPNEAIKSLVQKVKARISQPKVHEQK